MMIETKGGGFRPSCFKKGACTFFCSLNCPSTSTSTSTSTHSFTRKKKKKTKKKQKISKVPIYLMIPQQRPPLRLQNPIQIQAYLTLLNSLRLPHQLDRDGDDQVSEWNAFVAERAQHAPLPFLFPSPPQLVVLCGTESHSHSLHIHDV